MRKTLTVLITSAALVLGMMSVPGGASGAGGAVSLNGFTQCLNGGPPSTATNCPGGMTNGSINSVNSHYGEDEVVPQRLQLTVADTNNHTIHFSYLALKGGVHAYDSLATWNITQFTADPCQGIAPSICTGTPTTFPMASDTNSLPPASGGNSTLVSTHELPAASRLWTVYGGAVTATTGITYTGGDTANVTITFHASSANTPMIILFGGHLAVSGDSTVPRAWGTGLGASFVSGGPYHIDVADVDGGGGGPSNSIQAGALVQGTPEFSITKAATPTTTTPGGTVQYTITVTNNGTGAGSATFTDNFDDRLSPTTPVSNPSGGTCVENNNAGDLSFTCGTIQLASHGGSQTFTYTAAMPNSFTSGAGTGGCAATAFPVQNTATLATGGTPASVTVCVTAAASFMITKSADPTTANPGQTVTYTVTVKNTGSASGSTSFTDDFDDRLTPSAVTTTPTGGTCNVVSGTLQCTTSSIAAGQQQVFTYTAQMPATFSGPAGTGCSTGQFALTNTATLTGQNTGQSATVCVNAVPSFTISKSVTPTTAQPGATVTYTITVTNGGAAAGSTSFVDDYDDRLTPSAVTTNPAGGSCTPATVSGNNVLNCSTGTIAGGNGTQTFTYTATLPLTYTGSPGGNGCSSSNPQQYAIHNTVTLANNGPSDSATVCVNAAPAFTVSKTALPTTTTPGQPVQYKIVVSNTGDASGSTTFRDDFDDRLTPTGFPAASCSIDTVGTNLVLDCTTATILAGDSQTFTYSANMPASFTGASGGGNCSTGQFPVDNSVVLANGANDSAEVCVTAAPHFTISKKATPTSANPGDTVTYTVTVTNDGKADGSTTFTDDYDDRLTPSTVTSDPAGGSCTPGTVGTNQVLNCSTSDLLAGASQTFTYTAAMPATFSGAPGGSGCANNQYPVNNTAALPNDPATAPVTVCVSASPSFTITKSADPTTAAPGQTVTYTVTVTNNGTGAGSTTFTDDYDNRLTPSSVTTSPAGGSCTPATVSGNKVLQCSTSSLDPGDQQVFTYTAAMPASFGVLSPTAGCPSGQFSVKNSATLANNATASATVCVVAAPSFTITKSVSPNPANPGDTVTYTITVTNGGKADGSTTFTDDYDDRLTPSDVTISGSGGACTPVTVSGNKELSCSTGTIAALGGTQVFSYTATLPQQFTGNPGGSGCSASNPQQYPISNTATLANGLHDSATVCVNAAPDFTVTKTASPTTTTPGGTVQYTITVMNNGHAAGSTTFTDDYDDRLSPSTVTASAGGGCTPVSVSGNAELSCTTGTINGGGASETFTYTATMPASFVGDSGGNNCPSGSFPVDNSVVVTDGGSSDGAQVCVTAAPHFTIAKTVSPTTVSPGDMVTYTITVTNDGKASGSTSFTDDYDDRLSPSMVMSDPAGGNCQDTTDGTNKELQCTTGTILAGQAQTFTYTATVPLTFSGPSGGGGCSTGSYPITNRATLTSVSTGSDDATVCVTTTPAFRLTKTVDPTTAVPGQTVTYTVTVTNTGSGAGSTTFVDDYDDRLTPSSVTTNPSGGSCTPGTVGTNKVLNCSTSSIDPGGAQVFTYTAQLPATFSGDPGTGCQTGQYAVKNTATLAGDNSGTPATVCVNAAPLFSIAKSVSPSTVNAGDTVTYTITVTNSGTASGSTTFTDDYDDRLTPSTVTSVPSGGSCTPTTVGGNKVLHCSTGTILADAPNNTQVFTYTAAMPATFTGDPGGQGCTASNPQQYPVTNSATLANQTSDSATVCVNAAPSFTITKTASPTTANPGQTVQYTITVSNGGTASGTTTFTDDYDDRLSPSTVTSSPTGGSCTTITISGNKELSCITGTVLAKTSQTFSYTAVMPNTFTGIGGGAGCSASNPQQYPITNSVVLANGDNDAATVCVNAAPQEQITKTVVKNVIPSGDEQLVYTIAYQNVGHADAMSTQITDAIPDGTFFVSCTGGCQQSGSPVTSVNWTLGPTAALTGSGSVTLTVQVNATAVCQITNVAYLQFDAHTPVASNPATITIDPVANPAGAHASGSAIGAQVVTTGLVGISLSPIGQVSTSRSGLGPTDVANKSLVGISIPANGSLLRLPVINETSASGVSANPAFAQDVTSAAVDHVCLFPIANICTVQADTVQAVASTLATGAWATYSSGGSTIQNLKILGVGTVVNLNQTTKINLNPLVFGPNSYVAINERTGSAGLVNGVYVANAQVTMIHLVITGLLNLQSANIIVSQATSHADFPATLVCGNVAHQSVSGHAFVAQLRNAPTIADTTLGYVAIPPTGANESQQIVGVNLPANDSIIGAALAASRSFSNMNSTTSYSESSAEVTGNNGPMICVIKLSPTSCLITAQAVHSQSQSTATSLGAKSTDAGTSLANVSVAGIPIGLTVPPNTAIIIPGMGYVVLNEQMCDNGTLTYTHSCSGTHHSGLTVRAVDLVFTFLGSGLGVVPATQLIVAEAHSDATFGA